MVEAEVVDGRRLRREQNREAVLDALGDLFREGSYQPTADEIARRAGISARSLFRYFDDADDLSRAAIERELRVAGPLLELDVDPGAPLSERIDAVVSHRLRLHEGIGPTARAARVSATRNAVVAEQLRRRRALFRGQLERAFGPELVDHPERLAAADVLCSFEALELLRGDQRLSRRRTAAALRDALQGLLGAAR